MGRDLQGHLVLENVGVSAIRIFAVEPSCDDCTSVQFTAQDLAAGDHLAIPVRMTNAGSERHFYGRITIRSDDVNRPEFTVIQEGHFVPAVGVDAWVIRLGEVEAGTITHQPLKVLNFGGASSLHLAPAGNKAEQDMAAVDVADTSNHGMLSAIDLPKAVCPEQPSVTSLDLSISSPETAGPFRIELTFRTSNPAQPFVRISIVGEALRTETDQATRQPPDHR